MRRIEFIESYLVPDDGGDYQWSDNHGRLIRCCDCKYMQCNTKRDGTLPNGLEEYECRRLCCGCDPTDYCSWAVPRDEDGE